MIKSQPFFRSLLLFCALCMASLTYAQQWNGAGNSTGDIYREGNVSVGRTSPGIAPMDVRGGNIFQSPVATQTFPSTFTGMGESFGECNIYGFRAQNGSRNFINVGVKRPDGLIQKQDDILFNPTVSWGSQGFSPIPCLPGGNCVDLVDRPLNFEFDNNEEGCGEIVVQMFSPGSTYQMRVIGSAFANGSFVSSDARYKNEVETIDNALETVQQLRGVSYGFNRDQFPQMNFDEGRTNGFIAQEIKEVMPEVVKQDMDGYHAVNYDAVVPLLVEAIKEQNAVVEQQDAEIAQLRAEMTEIKAMLTGGSSKGSAAATTLEVEAAALYQNRPNPAEGFTNIPYFLPQTAQSAEIQITTITGQVIQMIPVENRGEGQIRIDSNTLKNGVYTYTLLVDGQRIDTKRMVVNK